VEKKAIGILAQDSNFAISQFPSHIRYLILDYLDMDKMTTMTVDSEKLASYLKLKKGHLPLLAVLKGSNRWMREGVSSAWVYKMFPVPRGSPFPHSQFLKGLAQSIRRVFADVMPNLQSSLDKLPIVLSKWPKIQKAIVDDDAVKALNSFFLIRQNIAEPEVPQGATPDEWNHWLEVTAELPAFIRNIAIHQEVKFRGILQDSSSSKSVPLARDLYGDTIWRRFYGVILHDKPGMSTNNNQISVWHCTNSPEVKVMIPLEPPIDIEHPGLETLLLGDEEGLHSIREKIVIYVMTGIVKDGFEWSEYGAVAFTLHALQQGQERPVLKSWEVWAFLLQRFVLNKIALEELKLRVFEAVPDVRAVSLAHVFNASPIIMVNQSCGSPLALEHLIPANNFDGNLFMIFYENLRPNNDEQGNDPSVVQWLDKERALNLAEEEGIEDKETMISLFNWITNDGHCTH